MGVFFERVLRPLLFALPPESAHAAGLAALKLAGLARPVLRPLFLNKDPRLAVTLGRGPETLLFPNPVGLAAGFDKDGEAIAGFESLGFGFLEIGTVTPLAQPGNLRPRLFRFPEARALVNRMGFNNAGAEALAARLARGPRPGVPLGINIGRNKDTSNARAPEDYLSALDKLFDYGDYFVVNVSSPNTPGLRDLQSEAALRPLLTDLRRRTDELTRDRRRRLRPLLFVKISPDEIAPETLADVALAARFDGIVATNTTSSREGLPAGAPAEGGVSGGPLQSRSTEILRRLAKAAQGRLILIATGGIFTARDAFEKILAGASLVELYTGIVYGGPGVVRAINRGLLGLLARGGFGSVAEAVGKAL